MSIDWEYLLDAEGDELEDAYEEAVEEACRMIDPDYTSYERKRVSRNRYNKKRRNY